jgi:Mn2+/Fe2+ NRAMP family transporter
MPHNIYLHSALVLSRKIDHNNYSMVKEACIYNTIESTFSLFISFLINFSVVGTFAYFHFASPGLQLNLLNAAIAFEDTFGNAARIIWGVGLLAAG